jgi:hypothetical protein
MLIQSLEHTDNPELHRLVISMVRKTVLSRYPIFLYLLASLVAQCRCTSVVGNIQDMWLLRMRELRWE